MSDDLKSVLVRGRKLDLSTEYGAAIVPEIVRRPITFKFIWTPVNAHRDPMVGLWTIEAVPFAQWFRLIIPTDAMLLRQLGLEPWNT